jgi:hypothetical protein
MGSSAMMTNAEIVEAFGSSHAEPPVIDLNRAGPQKGMGRHPGPPPSHRTFGSFAFRRWYREYLHSREWQRRREQVQERAHYKCEGCGAEGPTHIHHKTYARVGYEFLFDLIAVCPACHQRIHREEGRR